MNASPWDRFRPPISPGEPRAVFTGKLSDWAAQLGARPALQGLGVQAWLWDGGDAPFPSTDGASPRASTVVTVGGRQEGKTLLAEAQGRITEGVAHHIEREITEALTRALGDSWTPESLAGRTSRVVPPNRPETTYFLDDRPLLKIGVPQFSQVGNHLHYTLPVQRYAWSPAP